VQRIPLSDEYDPDSDFASDMGDPVEDYAQDRHFIPLNAEELRTLPSIIGHEAEIALARRNAVKQPARNSTRKHGC
jgi:hypothetical protein